MSAELLRAYLPDELGGDGYPHEWHGCCGELEHDPEGGIKDRVRAAAGHRCVRCGHPYRTGHSPPEWSPCDEGCTHAGPIRRADHPDHIIEEPAGEGYLWRRAGLVVEARWRVLTVHHLDGDKANCRWWNLAALCQRCHLTTQGKVVLARLWLHEHSQWFRPYVAGYYAWRYLGQELNREETVARIDELLALEPRQLTLEPTGARP